MPEHKYPLKFKVIAKTKAGVLKPCKIVSLIPKQPNDSAFSYWIQFRNGVQDKRLEDDLTEAIS